MFQFRDKTVYIISPERWSTMKVSKHHYALELADRNCRVFFIEPPDLAHKGISLHACPDHAGIQIVRYKPVFRGERFLPDWIYESLLRIQAKRIVGKIGAKPDVVWCFHGYLFRDLRWFGAAVNIYFAADQFLYTAVPPEIDSATLVLAVSDSIYARIGRAGKPVSRINHGLQKGFAQRAEELIKSGISTEPSKKVVAGYSGNLRMGALDRDTMMKVIAENRDTEFIFWGSYTPNELYADGDLKSEIDAFIDFLQRSPNVQLRGVVDSMRLREEMKEANLFWICWKIDIPGIWDGSNSHKVLEYLSTGKPVVSHYMSSYSQDTVLYMLREKSNSGYPALFAETARRVKEGEGVDMVQHRLQTAVDNAYSKQIDKIASLIPDA